MKLLLVFAFFTIIEFPQFTYSQQTDSGSIIKKKDTIFLMKTVVEKYSADSNYLQILEKTNAQLSLWWNPYGVLIAAVGILIAVLAIAGVYFAI